MPPEIVLKKLWAPIHLPLTQNVERFAVEHENAAGAVAIRRAERADVNTFRPAVNCVRTRIIGSRKDFLRLDDFHDLRLSRIRLSVDDVNTRGADPGHNEIAPFHVRMRRVRAERGTARVPTKVMQFVAKIWQRDLTDALTVGGRLGININNQQRVVELAARRI